MILSGWIGLILELMEWAVEACPDSSELCWSPFGFTDNELAPSSYGEST